MSGVSFQANRAFSTICSVCGLPIAPEQPTWHEPVRNWHAHKTEYCGPKFKKWVEDIDTTMKEHSWPNKNS
jgi:hypothetical protein